MTSRSLFRLLSFAGLISMQAFATSTLGSQTVTLSAAPTNLACVTQQYINKLTIRVIPGFEGKVFVGTPWMNTSTYVGVLSILFPNAGAHSEEYVLQDPSGDDGIDLCSIYVAGEIPGESAVAEYVSNTGGVTPPRYLFVPYFARGVSDETVNWDIPSTMVHVQVVPGGEGTQTVRMPGQESDDNAAILYPNTGQYWQHNAWSESWQMVDPMGNNGIMEPTYIGVYGEIPGEYALMSVWFKETGPYCDPASDPTCMDWASYAWNFYGYQITAGSPIPESAYCSGSVCTTPSVLNDLSIRTLPGYTSEISVNDLLGNLDRILYPNENGGFSEELRYANTLNSLVTNALSGDTATPLIVDYLIPGFNYLEGAVNQTIPPQFTTITSQIGGMITPMTGGTAIARGNVKHLLVSVVPGEEGKIYIGSSSMDTNALSGVDAILYPNAIGRWSETLEIDDPEGDGIQTDNIYLISEIPGESAIVSTVATGIAPADGVLNVKAAGPLSNPSSYGVPFAAASTPFSILRAQAIPGGEGKLWVGTQAMTAAQPDNAYANVLKVLWPSEGDYDVGEGHSERFREECHAGPVSAPNCLDLANFTFWPEIASEQLLVFALGR